MPRGAHAFDYEFKVGDAFVVGMLVDTDRTRTGTGQDRTGPVCSIRRLCCLLELW